MTNPEIIEIEGLPTIHKLCKFGADHNMEGCSFTEIVERMFDELESAQAQVPEWISISDRIPGEGQEVLVHHFGQIEQVTKDKKWHGGFKRRNCYGWETCYGSVSHWLPRSIELPKSHHFYYENDAKRAQEEVVIKAQEQSHD